MALFGLTAKLARLSLQPLQRGQIPLRVCSSRCFSQTADGSGGNQSGQDEIRIPLPKQRPGESLRDKKARLLYQSRKRGMLENGILLSTFADLHLDKFEEPELSLYDDLINLPSNDWDIYYWAIGQKEPPKEFDTPMLKKLQHHAQNEKMEMRIFPTL